MVRTIIACGLVPVALLAAGCGEKDEPEISGPPVVDRPTTTPSDPNGGEQRTGDGNGGVRLEEVGEFSSPVFVAQPEGESALYVVEREGRIMRVRGNERPQVFLDITRLVGSEGSEQGLLSMAFAPDYQRSGRFYVDYTDKEGDTRVVAYERSKGDPTGADPRSAQVLLRVQQPYPNHNGGLIMFGPDRDLYIGLGDGGSVNDPERNGQNLRTPLAKTPADRPRGRRVRRPA